MKSEISSKLKMKKNTSRITEEEMGKEGHHKAEEPLDSQGARKTHLRTKSRIYI